MDSEAANESVESLGSISRGAGLFLVGRGCKQIVGFLTNFILTRSLGTSLYGTFAYLNVIFTLFMVLTNLGGDKSVLRFIPEFNDRPQLQHITVTLAYGTSLAISVVVAAAVFHFAPLIATLTHQSPLFVKVLRVGAIVIPFNTLSNVTYSVFKSTERMEYFIFSSMLVQPLTRLVFVGGAVLVGFSVEGATAALVVSGVLTFATAFVILLKRTQFGKVSVPTRTEADEYYRYSIPLTFNQVGNFLYNRIDILMVGILLSSSAIGIYNIAVMISTILALPLTAFNQLFPPIASRLYHNDELAELEDVYGSVTRWIFTLSLFPGIAAILYANSLLSVFGKGFAQGAVVLELFVFAQLTNSVVGPSGFLLMMTDHQNLTLINQVLTGVINTVLNYVLILKFGFVGAAMATSISLGGINVLRIIEVWYLEGLNPYDTAFLKPLVAGVAAGVVMYLVSLVLSSYVLLVAGGVAGAVAYFAVLFLLGVEPEDQALLTKVPVPRSLTSWLSDRKLSR